MIVLVRHGHTEAARQGRCVGRTDVPLSAEGIAQAGQLAEVLGKAGFARLCSSPSNRARDTLAPLAGRLNLEPEIIPGLDEIDMGEWDGLSFDEIRARFPEAHALRGNNFSGFRPPGGESFNDVAARALDVLAALSDGPRPVLAVTHAGVIRSVLCRITGHPMDDLFHFRPGYAMCTVLGPTDTGLELVAEDVAPDVVGSLLER